MILEVTFTQKLKEGLRTLPQNANTTPLVLLAQNLNAFSDKLNYPFECEIHSQQ